MKNGKLFQLEEKDLERVGNRIFQKFDRNVEKKINNREIGFIYREVMRAFKSRKKPSKEMIEAIKESI